MRIVMVSPVIGDAYGQERVMRDSVRLLRGRGHEIFYLGERIAGASPEADGELVVAGLSTVQSLTPRRLVKEIHGKALRFLDETRPDLVHFIDQFDYRFMGEVSARFPCVFSAHTVAPTCPASNRLVLGHPVCPERSGWSCLLHHHRYHCLSYLKTDLHRAHAIHNFLLRRRALTGFSAIIAVSRFIQRTLTADGWDERKIRLIYNPVTLPEPAEPPSELPPNLVLCAARLVPLKGIDFLLRALKVCESLSWTLWICGDGPEKDRLQALARELAIDERVSFRSFVPPAELARLRAGCRLFVQPNIGPESFGLSVAEASAQGIPVVIFDVPALNEIVRHDQNGLVAKPRDLRSLAECMARLLTDEKLGRRLGQQGPKLMAENFSPQAHLEATLAVYSEAITSPQSETSRKTDASVSGKPRTCRSGTLR